jgi:predicted metal-dependent HD superfamily phosphohydrolase
LKQESSFSTPLTEAAREYVSAYIAANFPVTITYHNLNHVKEVVKAVEIIGRAVELRDEELEIVVLAAWFHDIGYHSGQAGHENKSAEIAKSFLLERGFPEGKTNRVIGCIEATRVPQKPSILLESIVCDADLFHLGSDKFEEKSDELWDELKIQGTDLSFFEWLKTSRDFIKSHKYHTSFARKNLDPKKEKNLHQLEQRISRMQEK